MILCLIFFISTAFASFVYNSAFDIDKSSYDEDVAQKVVLDNSKRQRRGKSENFGDDFGVLNNGNFKRGGKKGKKGKGSKGKRDLRLLKMKGVRVTHSD